tara:strand:- start:182 stop:499 length:318 start_codon:yes stop_codon:yes gene_type:complete
MLNQMTHVINDKNIMFNVVLSESENKEDNTTKMLVSFYDTRYDHTQYGQFIGRYYASTLLGLDGYGSGIKDRGLNLHGGIDDWSINAENANHVVDFIEGRRITNG